MLPAVPMLIVSSLGMVVWVGVNVSVSDPRVAPSTVAFVSFWSSLTQVRCCVLSPRLGLLCLIFSIVKGVFVIAESASAVRMICPPASPCDPSM